MLTQNVYLQLHSLQYQYAKYRDSRFNMQLLQVKRDINKVFKKYILVFEYFPFFPNIYYKFSHNNYYFDLSTSHIPRQ